MKRPVKRNPSDLERALAGDKNLKKADLKGANLKGADLAGANLKGADLAGADLYGTDLEGANLYGVDFEGANLKGANLTDAILVRADLSKANLAVAYLKGADLTGANLKGASLKDASLKGASLTAADLTGANLTGADLTGADLTGADLSEANLAEANLYGARLAMANLRAANLRAANLESTLLFRANLTGANITTANLKGADLRKANLKGANLEKAKLEKATLAGADLEDANLEDANLEDANLHEAKLKGAKLKGANLEGAHIRGANLEGADLTGANLTRVELEGANLTGAKLPTKAQSKPVKAYGRMTGPILKAHKPDAPSRAADFKKQYPTEFERLKADTQGRDFTPTLRQTLKAKYETPFEWFITLGKYKARAQRYCSEPNDVIKFNLDLDDPKYTTRQKAFLSKLRETSVRSGHPVEMLPYFTVGWVRFCVNDQTKTVLIEEVQSDVSVVRKKLKDGSVPGLEEYADVINDFAPIAERFYVDAIGHVFIEAEAKGYSVEMLDYPAKAGFDSPRELYTDLPKSMGMKLTPSQQIPSIDSTWYYKPNPKKRARAKRHT